MEERLGIYLLSQEVTACRVHFDSMVVVAKSADQARRVHPEASWGRGPKSGIEHLFGSPDDRSWTNEVGDLSGTWPPRPDQVKVQFLGYAAPELVEWQVLCASYND